MSKECCSVPGCERHARSVGMCEMHRRRVRLYGDAGGSAPKVKVVQECSVQGCERQVIAKGLCPMHYARKRINGDPGPVGYVPRRVARPSCSEPGCRNVSVHRGLCGKHYKTAQKMRVAGRKCSIPGCNKPHEARGFCEKHYSRVKMNGDPNKVLRKVGYGLGDKIMSPSGYVRIFIGKDDEHAGETGWCLEHRYVVGRALGRPLLTDETVHHKNGHRDDNRIENLELRSGHHGSGQAAHDLLEWAREIIGRYSGTFVDGPNSAGSD